MEEEVAQVKAQPHQSISHPVIFYDILQSKLPESEKTVDRLSEEALTMISAGTMTTSLILSVAMYHLIASPRILRKLRAELKLTITDPATIVPIEVLESLPYLAAVVKEALRLDDGTVTRL